MNVFDTARDVLRATGTALGLNGKVAGMYSSMDLTILSDAHLDISAGVPECRSAGVPECRSAGVPECRSAGVPAMRLSGAWQRCLRLPAPPPESSCAAGGRRAASRWPGSSSNSPDLPRHSAARGGCAVRRLRPGLLPALLCLALLGALAPDAAAQSNSIEVYFANRYFDSTGVPIPVRVPESAIIGGSIQFTDFTIRSDKIVTTQIGSFQVTTKLEGLDVTAAQGETHVKGEVYADVSITPLADGHLTLSGPPRAQSGTPAPEALEFTRTGRTQPAPAPETQ